MTGKRTSGRLGDQQLLHPSDPLDAPAGRKTRAPVSQDGAGTWRGATALIRRPLDLVRSSLLRNSSFLMATTVFNALLGYLFWVIVARNSPAHEVGLATAVITTFTLVSLVTNLGVSSLMIQVLPPTRDGGAWSALLLDALAVASGFSAVIALAVGLVLPHISSHFAELRNPGTLALLTLGCGLATATTGMDAAFISCRASGHMLFRNSFFGVVKLALVFAVAGAAVRVGALDVVSAWVASLGLSLVVGLVVQMRRAHPGFRPAVAGGMARLRGLWRSAINHQLANLGSTAVPFIIPLIIVARISVRANAFFYLTWSVGAVFMMISPSVSTALFAEGSHGEDLAKEARRSATFIAALLTPAIIVAFVWGNLILGVFGPQYAAHGTTLLRVLAISSIPDAVTNVAVSVMRVKNRLGLCSALNLSMAGITVVATWLLIPPLGLVAPGVGWLIGQSLGAVTVGVTLLVLRMRGTEIASRALPGDRAEIGLAMEEEYHEVAAARETI